MSNFETNMKQNVKKINSGNVQDRLFRNQDSVVNNQEILSKVNPQGEIILIKINQTLEDKNLLVKLLQEIAMIKDPMDNLNGMETNTIQNIKESENVYGLKI